MPAVRGLAAAALLALLALSPAAVGHAGSSIEVIAKDGPDCAGGEVCLELFSLPPDLAPGDASELELRNHPDSQRAYAASLTTPDRADPDRQDTPASAAIATTPAVEPGNRSHVEVTIPEADGLYAWLDGAEHEAQGGYEEVPISSASEGPSDSTRDPVPAPVGVLVVALAGVAWARRTRA